MKKITILGALTFGCALAALLATPAKDEPTKPTRRSIYDTKANGTKQIADALATAKREKKNVLVQFGANWCQPCHHLHTTLTTNPEVSEFLKAHFIFVLVDVDEVNGKPHNAEVNARYGDPIKDGIPALIVLDANGKLIKTQDTTQLEGADHFDPVKVLKFLKEWSPKPAK